MNIPLSSRDLFEFDIMVHGPKNHKKRLKALADTGSTDCAATYKVITTLRQRPVDHMKAAAINSGDDWLLVYHGFVTLNHKPVFTPIFRINEMPPGIDFIIGMSVLRQFKVEFSDKSMSII